MEIHDTSRTCLGQFLKSTMLVFIISLLNLINISTANAWIKAFPEVNRRCPDFTLENTRFFKDDKRSLSDFKGEYVILDFWSKYCAQCIINFPKVDLIQQKFRNRVRIILVGDQDKENSIEKLYNRVRENEKLNLPVAFDSILYRRFVPRGVPHLIWINPDGIVKAITGGYELTESNVGSFLSGAEFKFTDESLNGLKKSEKRYDLSLPFLIRGNGGDETDFLFRSIFSKWKPGMGDNYNSITGIDKKFYSKAGFNSLRVPLIELYNTAYFGHAKPPYPIYSKPILEISDSLLFSHSFAGDGQGLYCYSLQIPIEMFEEKRVMEIMKLDLMKYFSFKAGIEKRLLPCYVLKVLDSNKVNKYLSPKDVKASHWEHFTGGYFSNISIGKFASILGSRLPDQLRILDETNIKGNIAIRIDALLLDINEINNALFDYGLIIQSARRQMDVLVLKDQINN